MDYFSALKIFHSVAETESFSATAKLLGVAVSSITRQINSLEQHLGISLFARSTRQLTLTNAGKQYYQETLDILAHLAQANQALKDEYLEPQGTLKVTFPALYGNIKLMPLLYEFTERYPKIQLEIIATDNFLDLQSERIDLAIRVGKVNDERLIARLLAPQSRWLVASPDYLQKIPAPEKPSDLIAHNCLRYIYQGYATKWYFRNSAGKWENVKINGNLSANSAEILLQATLKGQGISHLPDWYVQPFVNEGKLVRVLADWQITPTQTHETDGIYIAYPPYSRNSVKISVLANFLTEKLTTSPI